MNTMKLIPLEKEFYRKPKSEASVTRKSFVYDTTEQWIMGSLYWYDEFHFGLDIFASIHPVSGTVRRDIHESLGAVYAPISMESIM